MSKLKINVVDYYFNDSYSVPNKRNIDIVKNISVSVDNGRLTILINGDEVFHTGSLTDGRVDLSLQDDE